MRQPGRPKNWGKKYAPKNKTPKVHNLSRHIGKIATTKTPKISATHQDPAGKTPFMAPRPAAPGKICAKNFLHVSYITKKRLLWQNVQNAPALPQMVPKHASRKHTVELARGLCSSVVLVLKRFFSARI